MLQGSRWVGERQGHAVLSWNSYTIKTWHCGVAVALEMCLDGGLESTRGREAATLPSTPVRATIPTG